MPTRIRWPEVEVELSDEQVDALCRELDALAETPTFAELAPEVRDRFRPGVTVDREQLSMPELLTLLRALDHLRNTGKLDREGQRVRDAMVAAPITYRLRIGWGSEEGNFHSYSGMYTTGDRLVPLRHDVFRVVYVEEPPEDEPTVLVCERW